jgi:glycosyltransferase involved in cell wall biosynthesis
MRVLYVNQTAEVSGAERSLLDLLQGLPDSVQPLVACPDGELAAAVEDMGIRRERIAGTRVSFRLHPLHTARGLADIFRSALQVRRLTARHQPDLVHANTTRAALLALRARDRSGPPVVAHIRDWVPEGRFPRLVLTVVGRRADAVVANSTYVGEQFAGLALRRPVTVVPNPVDLERFDPERADGPSLRRELGIAADAAVVAVVAQLTPWKAQDDAIRILAGLPARGPKTVLLLVGSAKFVSAATRFDNVAFERSLHELASRLGVSDRVHFAGERSDVPSVLAATDVLLMPSWREAFGRIAIEAMAMGVPVLATEVGGSPDFIRNGLDGLLLPPRRPEAWIRALEPLLDDAARRREMGAAAAERARQFDIPAHVLAMCDLYASLAVSGRAV